MWRICIWIKLGLKGLKGTCHEDIVVLSQFRAEIIVISKCHLTYTQNDLLEICRRFQTSFTGKNNHDNNIFVDFRN